MIQFSPRAVGRLVCVASFVSVLGPAQAGPQGGDAPVSAWIGAYSFSESTPPDITMSYAVSVCDAAGDAYIRVDGHMTEIRLKAKARQKNGKLELFFEGYGSDDMWKKGYDAGDLLLTIAQQGQGYRFVWGSLKSQLNEGARGGAAKKAKADCSATAAPEKWGTAAG
jgi:hypothetical protein